MLKIKQMNKKAETWIWIVVILAIIVVGYFYFNSKTVQTFKIGDCVTDYSSPTDSGFKSGLVTEIYQDYQGKGLAYKVVHNNDPKDFTISSKDTFKITNGENC